MLERVLIVGHGSIGKRHLRVVRQSLPNADIRVLRHRPHVDTPELANGCFSTLAQACAFAPQAAIIANPAPFHLNVACGLAEAGAHLLIEKPLSHDTNNVHLLLQRVRDNKLILQVGYNLRFLLCLQEFRARVRAGAIGRVLSVRCEAGQYLPSWRPDDDYRHGVSARREFGGGVLLELSHELDYLRWIFGDVTWLTAWLGRQSLLEIDVEDSAHLTLGFSADSSGRAAVGALVLDFIRHDSSRFCTAIGEEGSLRWNGLTGEVDERKAGTTVWRPLFRHAHERDDSYRAQWLAFLASVQNGHAPTVTGEDGVAVLELIAAARQSAKAQGIQTAIRRAEGRVSA